jgi:hypothetical protein
MKIKAPGFINENETLEMEINRWRLDGRQVVDYWSDWIFFWFGPGRTGSWYLGMEAFDRGGKGVHIMEIKLKASSVSDWRLAGYGADCRFAVDDLRVRILDGEGDGWEEL